MVKRAARYVLWATAILLGLIVLIWIALLVYVNANEKELIGKVTTVIQKRTRGDASIGGLSVSFIRTFPLLSLQLKDVTLRDSLYHLHKRNLLKASDVYLRFSIPGLITNTLPVGKVIISGGEINIISDTAGNSNEYVLKSTSKDGTGSFSMPDLVMRSVILNYEAPERKKKYHAIVRSLRCVTREKKEKMVFSIKMSLVVKNLSFNTLKGAYLKEKFVGGNFDLEYHLSTREIVIDRIRLDLGGHPFYFTGKFSTDKTRADFNLDIAASNILYQTATSFLTEKLQKKLNDYNLTKPIDLKVHLSGKTVYRSIPLIRVNMDVENNELLTPRGVFDNCTLTGLYTNEKIKGRSRTDENSILQFTNFHGRWESLVISSKKILISNLINPFLECDVSSDVDLKSINSLTGSRTIQFLSGKSTVNVVFKGLITGKDSLASNIGGAIDIYNASIKYIPRNFLLTGFNGSLKFNDNDLVVQKISATAGKTKLSMNGKAKNFLSLLNVSPEKLVLTWNITSPALHLEDFKPFLSKAEATKAQAKKAQFQNAASRVDRMFSDGDMYINLQSPVMEYKSFKATDVSARVVMKPREINFEKVELKHANGSMEVRGSLRNGARSNPVSLKTVMRDMDVPLLFTAFRNFGQDAVTYRNLKGKLSANINFNTAINNNADLISDACEGTIHFLLENGELNNFEPLQEISRKAFKKQDFSNIRFADVKNRLDVRGTTFIVNTMDIRSTALNFVVEGTYDVKKGTDMSIKFPLNNLTKSQANTDISDGGRSKKGVTLRLRVKTGDDGKLKVTWDPFRRSIRKKEDARDSAEVNRQDR